VPLLLNGGCVDPRTVDACECGFFSAYVDEKLDVKPCSFAVGEAFTRNLLVEDFATIWNNAWEPYRQAQSAKVCSRECVGKAHCRGKCSYFPELSFCHTQESP
jgi:radical SAM protein with 4Fe4S-binding SPASM domain